MKLEPEASGVVGLLLLDVDAMVGGERSSGNAVSLRLRQVTASASLVGVAELERREQRGRSEAQP